MALALLAALALTALLASRFSTADRPATAVAPTLANPSANAATPNGMTETTLDDLQTAEAPPQEASPVEDPAAEPPVSVTPEVTPQPEDLAAALPAEETPAAEVPAAETLPAPSNTPPAPAVLDEDDGRTTVLLEDTSWQGGYSLSRGSSVYGGRTATWIYGAATEYGTMQATFEFVGQPTGMATLAIEGMDSEDQARTPISVQVNGTEIYSGPNPLPDDDFPLESGTWATEQWTFDAALLVPGANTVSISNLSEGSFGQPPFFMLDYARLSYSSEG